MGFQSAKEHPAWGCYLAGERSEQALQEWAKRQGSKLLLHEEEEHQGRMEVTHKFMNFERQGTQMATIKKSSFP